MEKEIYGYIYKIRNKVNEKVYIGLTTSNFDKRYPLKGEGIERVYNYHAGRRKCGVYYNIHLLNSIEKYGFEAFEITKEFDIAYSEEELKEKEKYWISYYKSNDVNYGYNRTEGGDGVCGLSGKNSPGYKGFVVVSPDGEVSKEMTGEEVADYLNVSNGVISDLAKEKTCYIGKYEHIRYIRVLHLEYYLEERKLYKSNEDFKNMCKQMVEEAKNKEEEERKKKSEANKGENNPFYGGHHSEESIKKISEAGRNRKVSEETKKKLSEAHKKLLVCIFPDGRIIKDICGNDLAKELGVGRNLITNILHSKEPYKLPKTVKKSDYERLKKLEGVIIMTQEDYLNIIKNKFSKAS